MEDLKTWLNTVIKVQTYKSNFTNSSIYLLDESKDKPFSPGQKVFNWNVEYVEFIGEGAFSVVHRMRDIESKKEFAVKTIKNALCENPDIVKTFQEEAENYISLGSQENIIQAEQFVIDDRSVSWLFMEFARGNSLRHYLSIWHPKASAKLRNEVKIDSILIIALGIATGLKYAASKNIFHHDIKPENIIITEPALIPKLIDFGGAVSDKLQKNNPIVFGTPEYSSPEHYAIQEYDEQSDIYSFGILLHEMLTGRLPFSFETKEEYSNMQLRKDPNISSVLSEDLKEIIKGCLNYDKGNRTSSFSTLIEQLELVYKHTTGKNIPDFLNNSTANTQENLLARASLLNDMAYYSEAIECYEKADKFQVAGNPKKDYLLDWSYCLKEIGRLEEANDKMNEWKSLNKDTLSLVQYYNTKALISEDPEEAIVYFNEAIKLDKSNPILKCNLGWAYTMSDDFKKAEEIFLNLANEYPNNSLILYFTGGFYRINNLGLIAIGYYKKVLDYDKINTQSYISISEIYQMYGDYIQAENWAKKALEKSLDKKEAYVSLIKLYDGFSNLKKKETAYLALNAYPGDEKIISTIESCFNISNEIFTHPGMKRRNEKSKTIAEETKKSPFEKLRLEIKVLVENNREKEAKERADEYINSNPNAVMNVFTLGHLFNSHAMKYDLYKTANNRSGKYCGETFLLEIKELIRMDEIERAEERFSAINNDTEFRWYDYYSMAEEFFNKGKFELSGKYLKEAEKMTHNSYSVDILRFKLMLEQGLEDSSIDEAIKTILEKYQDLESDSIMLWIGGACSLKNKYERSAPLFEIITSLNPEDSLYWFMLGNSQEGLQKYQEAEESFNIAIRLNPENAARWSNLGNAQYNQQKYQKAEESFNQAIKLNPANAVYWNYLGLAQSNQQKYKIAEKIFRRAIKRNPEIAAYWNNLGNAQYSQQKYQEAEVNLKKATELDKENATYWIMLANSQLYQKKYLEAEENYKNAIKRNRRNDDYWNKLVRLLVLRNDYSKVEKCLRIAVKLKPENVEYWKELGSVQFNQKKYSLADQSFEKVIKLNSEDAKVWACYGTSQYHQQKYAQSEVKYKKATELDKENPVYWNNLGNVQCRRQKYQEAEVNFKRATELDKEDSLYWNNLGYAQYNQQKYQEAEVNYTKAIELNPNKALYWNNLSMAQKNQQKYQKAEESIKKAIELDPDDLDFKHNLEVLESIKKDRSIFHWF